MRLGEFIAREGKAKGLCPEWRQKLSGITNKSELLQLYLEGIDFCLLADFPSKSFLKKEGGDLLESLNIHIDSEDFTVRNESKIVCLGVSKGRIECSGYDVTEVFVKHDSEITIHAEGDSFVMVDVFENSQIHIIASERAKVCVNRYGGDIDSILKESAKVKVIEKHRKNY